MSFQSFDLASYVVDIDPSPEMVQVRLDAEAFDNFMSEYWHKWAVAQIGKVDRMMMGTDEKAEPAVDVKAPEVAEYEGDEDYDEEEPHATDHVVLKMADIDLGIIPVVEWLNSFTGIVTRHSCEGDTKWQGPYVVFYCDDPMDLATVLNILDSYGECHVEWYREGGSLRYYFEFASAEMLGEFSEGLVGEGS